MKTFTKLAAATSLVLFAGAAHAASHAAAPLDADNDGMLTEEEFAAAAEMGMVFTAVDSDGDGMVSEAEYNDAARSAADEDDDGSLNDREFARYDEITRMFSQARADRDAVDFATVDADGDGMISDEERMAADTM